MLNGVKQRHDGFVERLNTINHRCGLFSEIRGLGLLIGCVTHALWRDLSDRLTGFLNNITLGELVNNQEVLDVSGRQHTHDAPRSNRNDAIDVKLRA